MLIELLKAILFGIVEGITEWLPVSSTGHMILLDEFIKLKVSPEFYEMFQVVIQLGAIGAVLLLFFHKLNPFSPKKNRAQKEATWSLWFKVVIAVLPSAVLGLLLDGVTQELRAVLQQEQIMTDYMGALKQFRMKTMSPAADASNVLREIIAAHRKALESGKKAGSLSQDAQQAAVRVIALLEGYLLMLLFRSKTFIGEINRMTIHQKKVSK